MISIVVHAKGDPELLAATLRSVAHGTYPDKELLVIGDIDGLADRLEADCDAFRIAWMAMPGLSAAEAFNEALHRTTGAIVSMLSAGDLHFDETLRIVAEAADRDRHAGCFFGDAMLTDLAGRPVAEFNIAAVSGPKGLRHCRFCPPSMFIRRDAIERVGGLDPALRHWADYDLWLRLQRSGVSVRQIPRLLAARRMGANASEPTRSDFTSLPTLESLDELMTVRLRSTEGWLSTSRLAWYGVLRSTITRRAASVHHDHASAMEHALAAHRRWNDGRRMTAWRRLSIAAKIARGMSRDRFLREFTVRPLETLSLKRFQPFRRRIFRLMHHAPRPLSLPRSYARFPAPHPAPSISIVTPSFNQGSVLESTIQSVLDQRYPALEYVVQDGGSTDESVAILERYGSRLAAWESAPDGGQASAINLGMRRMSGEIMAYLNSDDLLLPGSLAYVASYFQRHPEVDVVYGHRILIDERGCEIGRWVLPPHDDRAIAFADFIPQETMFWRRTAWEAAGGRIDESFRFAMDWDLILRFRAAGLRFRRLPRFLGAFRVWANQKSVSWWLPVGRRETERLTARTLGDTPTRERVRHEIQPYLNRHWMLDKLYLAGLVRY